MSEQELRSVALQYALTDKHFPGGDIIAHAERIYQWLANGAAKP